MCEDRLGLKLLCSSYLLVQPLLKVLIERCFLTRVTDQQEEKSSWAAPSNKNPLEKKQVAHGGEEAVEEAEEGIESAKQSVKDTAQKAKDAVDKLSGKAKE